MDILTLKQFKLTFKGGKESIVNDQQAHLIDDAYEQFKKTNEDKMVRLPGGERILISKLSSIESFVDQDLIDKQRAIETKERIDRYSKATRTEKSRWWMEKIRENLKRLSTGLPWVYYSKEGNVCTKEEAIASFN